MSKPSLQRKINELIGNVPKGSDITIYYTNPVTGETTQIFPSPAEANNEATDPKPDKPTLK